MEPHALSAYEVVFADESAAGRVFVSTPLAEHQRREAYRRVWRQDAARATGIVHPAFLPVVEVGETARLLWRSSPAFDGASLGALARRLRAVGHDLGPRRALTFLAPVSSLVAAFGRAGEGTCHGHLGLEHVWLATDGRIVVTGLPMEIGEDDPRLTALRATFPVEGLAPEQLLDQGNHERTDVYLVALLLATLLSGGNPFGRRQKAQTVQAVLEGTGSARGFSRLPGEVRDVFNAALSVDPGARPSAAELDQAVTMGLRAEGGALDRAELAEFAERISLPRSTPDAARGPALQEAVERLVDLSTSGTLAVPARASGATMSLGGGGPALQLSIAPGGGRPPAPVEDVFALPAPESVEDPDTHPDPPPARAVARSARLAGASAAPPRPSGVPAPGVDDTLDPPVVAVPPVVVPRAQPADSAPTPPPSPGYGRSLLLMLVGAGAAVGLVAVLLWMGSFPGEPAPPALSPAGGPEAVVRADPAPTLPALGADPDGSVAAPPVAPSDEAAASDPPIAPVEAPAPDEPAPAEPSTPPAKPATPPAKPSTPPAKPQTSTPAAPVAKTEPPPKPAPAGAPEPKVPPAQPVAAAPVPTAAPAPAPTPVAAAPAAAPPSAARTAAPAPTAAARPTAALADLSVDTSGKKVIISGRVEGGAARPVHYLVEDDVPRYVIRIPNAANDLGLGKLPIASTTASGVTIREDGTGVTITVTGGSAAFTQQSFRGDAGSFRLELDP